MSEQSSHRGARTARGEVERTELSKRAQGVARRAAESKATIPHAYCERRASVGDLEGEECLATVIAQLGRALRSRSGLNCSYRDGGLETHSRVNVGFTVETTEGALTPTIFDADRKESSAIRDEIADLRGRAEAGSLASPDLSGGTFSLTSVEVGADRLAGSVTPGQVGHLGIGRIHEAAVAREGGLEMARVVELCLSYDQRAVRPPQAALFIDELAQGIEATQPSSSRRVQ